MRFFDISILGWIHSAACMIALAAGPIVFAMTKGTRLHRKAGYWYAASMAAACITSLGLFAPIPGLPMFNRFHWMAIATLALVGLGVWAAQKQRSWIGAYSHPVLMVASYEMLVGGAINEAFARIGSLRAAAMAGSPWTHTLAETRMVGQTQAAAGMFFLLMIVWFVAQVAERRRWQALSPTA